MWENGRQDTEGAETVINDELERLSHRAAQIVAILSGFVLQRTFNPCVKGARGGTLYNDM